MCLRIPKADWNSERCLLKDKENIKNMGNCIRIVEKITALLCINNPTV